MNIDENIQPSDPASVTFDHWMYPFKLVVVKDVEIMEKAATEYLAKPWQYENHGCGEVLPLQHTETGDYVIICLIQVEKFQTYRTLFKIVTHEATHIKQHVYDFIGEKSTSTIGNESEAYFMGDIVSTILSGLETLWPKTFTALGRKPVI